MENPAIKNGVILGVIWILFNLLLYLINPNLIGGLYVNAIFLAAVFFMWKSANEEKALNDGFLSFGEGFKSSLLTILIGLFIGLLFKHLLSSVIDPELPELLKDNALSQIEVFSSYMSEEQLEAASEAIEEQDFSPTIVGTLSGYLMLLVIPYLPTALIIGAITKKENKSFA